MFGIYSDPDIGGADKDDNGLLFHLSTHQSHYTPQHGLFLIPIKLVMLGEGWVI